MGRIYIPYNKAYGGFLVDVTVDNSYLAKKRLSPPPPAYKTKALIDTGATLCGASEKLIAKLKLPATNDKLYEIKTGNGSTWSKRLYCAFSVDENTSFRSDCCILSKLDLGSTEFEFLIGMNVLEKWGMSYNPKESGLWLEYPPA